MKDALAGWARFWFEPQSTATLALVRIAYGALTFVWTLTLLPTLDAFFTDDGILPQSPAYDVGGQEGLWTVLEWLPSDGAILAVWAALLISSLCLTLGLFSRVAALVLWIALMSFERRNPYVFHAGDVLLRIIGLYLVFAPTGAALSLDRLRRHRDRFWTFPARAPNVLRLLQIQLSIIYVSTVWAKVRGESWNDGTALVYSLNLDDLARFPVPDFVTESAVLANLATWSVLLVELGIGVLVWIRPLRKWVLLAGVGLHIGIDIGLTVGFFSYTMFVLYVAFIPPERAERLVRAIRDLASGKRAWTDVRLPGRPRRQKVVSAPLSGGDVP